MPEKMIAPQDPVPLDPETVISTCRDRATFLIDVFTGCDADHLTERGQHGLVSILNSIEEDLDGALARLGESC